MVVYTGTLDNDNRRSRDHDDDTEMIDNVRVIEDTIKRVTLSSSGSNTRDYRYYYQPRNVDRNASFNLTSPITYVFALPPPPPSCADEVRIDNDGSSSSSSSTNNDDVTIKCSICDIQCTSSDDLGKHKKSRKHRQRHQLHTLFLRTLQQQQQEGEEGEEER
ncbi:hypothetical protein FOZ63_003571 [Perkinsus olseni]|uniref:C2H2-type domain-containing protein n=1 Tax=Perkinsus olseni TaxID=32597 RepID=A0A7J6UPN0_PEROL|nr:hypothetical protein FOZ63_003571 [Perkinsus olseni]